MEFICATFELVLLARPSQSPAGGGGVGWVRKGKGRSSVPSLSSHTPLAGGWGGLASQTTFTNRTKASLQVHSIDLFLQISSQFDAILPH